MRCKKKTATRIGYDCAMPCRGAYFATLHCVCCQIAHAQHTHTFREAGIVWIEIARSDVYYVCVLELKR